MNTNPKVPLNFKTGLGYSPSAGPPTGGWAYMPVSNFFGDPVADLLPSKSANFGFGKRRRKFRKRSFGFPLSDQPSKTLDLDMFPNPPVGPGDTPGGNGGVFLQGMPSFQQYWGYGKRKSKAKPRFRFSRRKRSNGKKRKRSTNGKKRKRSNGKKRKRGSRKGFGKRKK